MPNGKAIGVAYADPEFESLSVTGTASLGGVVEFGTSGPTITVGSGAPSAAAPQGSLYIRTDGTGAGDSLYTNTRTKCQRRLEI
jgi:hypothetical protein